MANAPFGWVCVCREKPVTGLDSSTMADGMGAPAGSVTIPRKVPAPPNDCAAAGRQVSRKANSMVQVRVGAMELSIANYSYIVMTNPGA